MTLKSYADVQAFISRVLTENNESARSAPHHDFWSTLSYVDFVNGTVPHVTDPATKEPVPILVKGNSAQSNLILALRGQGPLFNPDDGPIGQMPADGPPFFTDDQIKEIADWIDAGAPE